MTNRLANKHDVPYQYIRNPDPTLLPPRVGHNWNDQAFRKFQNKPQQLEDEWRGKRAFISAGNWENPPPTNLHMTAHQLAAALAKKPTKDSDLQKEARAVTLSDKVLRFFAFFTEKSPDGCTNEYWHRHVVIYFYPEDDTVLVQEPVIPNSGMDGGTFLKRQKVLADPRQRELYPEDEYLTLNFFNVGEFVRMNSVDFFIYDCDPFTREFLTMLGINVGEPVLAPDDAFMTKYKIQQQKMLSGKFGLLSQEYNGAAAERSARFVRDSGKVARFYGLLDERDDPSSTGKIRKLEVLMFLEDDTIAIVERRVGVEATPSLFLSRTWLPKDGSIAKANELTFAHRVNGVREPYIGENKYYKEADLSVGGTLNVYGRQVLLYDCDEFTRELYQKRYGITLKEPVDVTAYFTASSETVEGRKTEAKRSAKSLVGSSLKRGDTLRFLMRLSQPKTHADRFRRFTLNYYTETEEAMVYETPVKNSGFLGGCFLKRQRIPKPRDINKSHGEIGNPVNVSFYTLNEIRVGKEIVVNGYRFDVTNMDVHTSDFLEGKEGAPPTQEQVKRLRSSLIEFLGSRYGSAVKAFLAFDRDKDGVISFREFLEALKEFQIAEDPSEGQALFDLVSSNKDAAYLLSEDIMALMGDKPVERKFVSATGVTATDPESADKELRGKASRRKILLEIREKLEGRCMKCLQMFRLASTMPRAYREKCATPQTLTNPSRDSAITPVQLRRCIEEILGALPTEDEMHYLIHFFFPSMPLEQHFRLRDDNMEYAIELKEFQQRYNEMVQLAMLPENRDNLRSTDGKSGDD